MRVIALALLVSSGLDAAAQVTCPSLATPQVTAVSKNVTCLAAGHIDNDGRTDVVVGTDANEIVLNKATVDFSFTPIPISLPGRPVAVTMGDFDGNTFADVAVVHSSSLVSVLLLDPSFALVASTTLRADDNPVAISAADLNADTKLDLVVANMFSNNVSVFVGDGAGGFSVLGTYPAGTAPAGIAAADFNGDNHVDVVVANFTTNNVSLLLGDGTGKLDTSAPQTFAVGTDPSAVAAGDFNNDGVPDIATANFGSSNVSILIGARTAGAYTPLAAASYAAGRAPVAITAAHFDSGANLDLIVSNGASATVSLLTGAGDGTFAAGNSQAVDGLPWGTTGGQFDDSFVKGIAAAHFAAPSFSVFTSNCPGPPYLRDFSPTVGPVTGGQLVKITGHTLSDTIKVEFGTAEATIVSKSGNVVTVMTPPYAGQTSVLVKVTTSSGSYLKGPYFFRNPLHITGSPFNGSRGGFQYALIDAGTSTFGPRFKDIVKEIRIGPLTATITYDQVPFPLPPQWRGDGNQVFIRTPRSPDGGVGTYAVTVVTEAGTQVMGQQYTYTDNVPDALEGVTRTVVEDTPTTIVLEAQDPDIGDVLGYALTTPPTKGKVSAASNPSPLAHQWVVVYTPNRDATGTDSFAFTANDGLETSIPAIVPITITPVNDPPVATSDLITTPEETNTGIILKGSDLETASLTNFAVVSGPAMGTLNGTAPNLTYVPNPNAYGRDSFRFTVSDGELISAPGTVTIEITNVNDAPAATPQSKTTAEDTSLDLTLTGTDLDADGLGFEILSQPSKGVLTGAGPMRLYKPNPNVFGTDTFTFRVHDGTENSAPATVTVEISPVNDAPVAVPQAIEVDMSTSKTIVLAATDVESSPLTYTIGVPPGRGSLEGAPPNVKYVPLEAYIGNDSFTFTANDGSLSSAPATVSITVAGPLVTAAGKTVRENAGHAEVTLRLSRTLHLPILFKFSTADNSATAPGDYQKSLGTLTFAAGESEKTVRIPIVDDAVSEPDESFSIMLSNFSNASTDTPRIIVRIQDDDPPPLVVIGDVVKLEGDAGTTRFDFTLTLRGETALTVAVRCATADGTALAGSDYTARAETIVFEPGQKVRTFSVSVLGDTLLEGSETFTVVLTPLLNATTAGPGTGLIVNDESSRRRSTRH